jgi:hypothetical protein
MAQPISAQAIIPTNQRIIQAVVHSPTMRSVWLVTPVTPGNHPRENSAVQPDKRRTNADAAGIASHFERFFN